MRDFIDSYIERMVVLWYKIPRPLKGSIAYVEQKIRFLIKNKKIVDRPKMYSPSGGGSSYALVEGHASTLTLLLLLALSTACLSKKDYSEAEIQALMDKEVARKVADYRSAKTKSCEEEALRKATQIADSLIIAEAFYERDTFLRPPKPIKPDEKAPEIKGPDTIQLKPLFEGKRKKVKADTVGKKKN